MYNSNQIEMWNNQNFNQQKEEPPKEKSSKTLLAILIGVVLTVIIVVVIYFTMRKEHGQILFSLDDIKAGLPQVI